MHVQGQRSTGELDWGACTPGQIIQGDWPIIKLVKYKISFEEIVTFVLFVHTWTKEGRIDF
jgi:hypothetical protein